MPAKTHAQTPAPTHAPIACPSCGKRFRWKPELAGRRVKCPCGTAISVAAEPAAPPEADDLYDVAPDPAAEAAARAASRRAAAAAPPPVETQAAPPTGLGPAGAASVLEKLGRPVAEIPRAKERLLDPRCDEGDEFRPSLLRDGFVPSVLIAAGLALAFAEAMRVGPSPAATAVAALPAVGLKLVLGVGLMLGGMALAVVVAEVCFLGPLPKTAFKLAAIAVGVAPVYGLLSHALGDTGGAAAGTFASVLLYGVLFKGLMRLDLKDASICVIITWILVTAANYMAYKVDGLLKDSWV